MCLSCIAKTKYLRIYHLITCTIPNYNLLRVTLYSVSLRNERGYCRSIQNFILIKCHTWKVAAKNIMWCDVKYLPFSLCIIALTLIILWAFMKCYLLLCYWAECSSELFWSPVVRLWVRRPSACPPLRKRSHFHFLPQNQLDNFNPTWHKASLGDVNSCLFK